MKDRPTLHVVLLAGGRGTRFWPLSRRDRPKPFLRVAGGRSLLAGAWSRALKLAPPDRIWAVAPARLERALRAELPRLRPGRFVAEPAAKDTGPAVALAAAAIARHDPSAVTAIFPCDHVIDDTPAFVRAVAAAHRSALAGALVCLGVVPDRVAAGFGYLDLARHPRGGAAIPVRRFVEKPSAVRARALLRSGRCLWNAGIFVWRNDRFREEAARVAPRIARAAEAAAAGRRASWARIPAVSVDRAVLEKASGLSAVRLDAGWDDLGSWDAAARRLRTAVRGKASQLLVRSPESVVFADRRFVAVVDVPGVVIVDTPDALLVMARRASETARETVRSLASMGREDLL